MAEHYTVPLLVPAGASGEAQGVVRIINATEASGTVEIHAIDDAGARSGPATFTLNASAAVEFTATDLASGNATLGLTGGIGTDVGDARLEIETDLDIVPLAFVRAADGTLSAMHDTVRSASADESGQHTYDVPIFNPSTEMTRVSRLRLINPGDTEAAVTIGGRDDSGAQATGGGVSLTVPPGGAKTLTAQQLEAGGTDITGRLGAGTGNWRLTVSSDRALEVVNIVASTAGHWNNLSTTAVRGAAPMDEAGLNERFVGHSVIYETGSGRSALALAAGERFSETVESDGVTATHMGAYGYAGIGPDAGRMTLAYDGGDECVVNLYFASRTTGWFASHCTGSDYPAEGTWLGGPWSVGDDEDDGGEVTDTAYGVDDALPGVPTSGAFVPSVLSGGSVSATGAGTTIALNDGGYFELSDGTRYTCTSNDGCSVVNGTVTQGSVTGRAAGAAANTIPYAPIELYLAGLVPPEHVPDIWVAEDGAFLYDGDGASVYDDRGYPMFTASRVSTYTVEDIIAEQGARVPDSLNSQREFQAVVVLLVNEENPATRELLDVVSRDVDWFGHDGIDEFPSIYNFHEATGGRATITVGGLGQLALDHR